MRNNFLFLTFSITILALSTFAQQTGIFIDTRDGQVYNIVKIGNQTWMTQNLNTAVYSDGKAIALTENIEEWQKLGANKKPASCFYEFNKSNDEQFGRLYNWYAVKTGKLCPSGWHVPTENDWVELEKFLGEESNDVKIKSCSGWPEEHNGTNESGFNAIPSGALKFGSFQEIDSVAYWWASDYLNNKRDYRAYNRNIGYDYSGFDRDSGEKDSGFSVRCVKNN